VVAVGEATIWRVLAAHHRPEPALVLAPPHERPGLVEFEDITGLGREQGLLDGGQAQEFFLTTA
jgi:hypothetical protein